MLEGGIKRKDQQLTLIDIDVLERSHELRGGILLASLLLFLPSRLSLNMLQINSLGFLLLPKAKKF